MPDTEYDNSTTDTAAFPAPGQSGDARDASGEGQPVISKDETSTHESAAAGVAQESGATPEGATREGATPEGAAETTQAEDTDPYSDEERAALETRLAEMQAEFDQIVARNEQLLQNIKGISAERNDLKRQLGAAGAESGADATQPSTAQGDLFGDTMDRFDPSEGTSPYQDAGLLVHPKFSGLPGYYNADTQERLVCMGSTDDPNDWYTPKEALEKMELLELRAQNRQAKQMEEENLNNARLQVVREQFDRTAEGLVADTLPFLKEGPQRETGVVALKALTAAALGNKGITDSMIASLDKGVLSELRSSMQESAKQLRSLFASTNVNAQAALGEAGRTVPVGQSGTPGSPVGKSFVDMTDSERDAFLTAQLEVARQRAS